MSRHGMQMERSRMMRRAYVPGAAMISDGGRVAKLESALRANYEFLMPDGSLCFCYDRSRQGPDGHFNYCLQSRAALEPQP